MTTVDQKLHTLLMTAVQTIDADRGCVFSQAVQTIKADYAYTISKDAEKMKVFLLATHNFEFARFERCEKVTYFELAQEVIKQQKMIFTDSSCRASYYWSPPPDPDQLPLKLRFIIASPIIKAGIVEAVLCVDQCFMTRRLTENDVEKIKQLVDSAQG